MTEPAAMGDLAALLQRIGRDDLAARATAASDRLKRPTTIVCVVGEFKQGKSSLVNGLLGSDVCPVDDDLATSAITVIRYGESPRAIVTRREDSSAAASTVTDWIELSDVGEWVSERGNPLNNKAVERVEIEFPSPLLKQGLVLVDTPGMGGLGAGHAAATLGFLPFADGLLFTSDASAELSAPEIAFLGQATELCPTVLFALTKTDLYATWPKIAELNHAHIANAGFSIPIVPVSSAVRAAALSRRDRSLNDASGIPQLIARLRDGIVEPAKALAAQRSEADVRSIVAQVRAGLVEERRALTDAAAARRALAELGDAKDRIEHLRGPGARWSTVIADRMADLSNNVMHALRTGTRSVSRVMDERIEQLTKGDEWDDLSRWVQTVVATQVTDAFVALERGRVDTHDEVATLIRDEALPLAPDVGFGERLDIGTLWPVKGLDQGADKGKRAFATGLTTVRGAQGGVIMFGVLGSFLPKAAGLLLASNPVLLSVGAIFGGLGLTEDRRRKVQARRQGARSQVRQFLDDVQFEVGNQIASLVREIQRDLRDTFSTRLTELRRTYGETVDRVQSDIQRSQTQREARLAEIDTTLAGFDRIVAP